MHSKAISGLDWMDWILLKKLVLLEHLAVLMKTQPAGTGFDSKISSLKGGRVGVGVPAVEERRKGGEIHQWFDSDGDSPSESNHPSSDFDLLNKVWLRDLELKVECIDHL